MRLHFVPVPVHDGGEAEAELNQFLATHRILAVDRQLIADGPRSTWAVCITYAPGTAKDAALLAPATGDKRRTDPRRVDYRDELPSDEFQVFAKLRELRKKLSERDGVPPYALFTNEQLAEMVRRKVRTLTELSQIDGIGPARQEKYGRAFLDLLIASFDALPLPSGSASASA